MGELAGSAASTSCGLPASAALWSPRTASPVQPSGGVRGGSTGSPIGRRPFPGAALSPLMRILRPAGRGTGELSSRVYGRRARAPVVISARSGRTSGARLSTRIPLHRAEESRAVRRRALVSVRLKPSFPEHVSRLTIFIPNQDRAQGKRRELHRR